MLDQFIAMIYFFDGNDKDRDHTWTYLVNDHSGRGYHMVPEALAEEVLLETGINKDRGVTTYYNPHRMSL